MELHIVIDSREQKPWSFPDYCKTTVAKIDSGDYSLFGDSQFSIERKEKNDFLGTISKGWARFCRELNRMDQAGYKIKVIIIECNFEEFCFSEHNGQIIPPAHEHYMLTPQFIYKRIAELTMRGVSVLFAGDSSKASEMAYRILIERNKVINENTGS